MKDVAIVAAVRTPVGKLRGALSQVRPDDLAAYAIEQLLARCGVREVDEVFFGCANQAGEDNRNVARMALLLAGLPEHVPGVTLNRLCASGLEACVQAARAVRLGDMDLCVAGGVESMTRAPWAVMKPPDGFASGSMQSYDTALGWRRSGNGGYPSLEHDYTDYMYLRYQHEHGSVYDNARREPWANFVETGPGFRVGLPFASYLTIDLLRGTHLRDHLTYTDFRAGIWYAFSH